MSKKPSALCALFNKHREIIMYCIFGVVTTLVSWASYSLFEASVGITAANAISWVLAIIVAFVTNKLWVFDSKSWEARLLFHEAVTFVGGRALTGVFELVSVPLLVEVGLNQTLFGVEGLPAKIVVSVFVVVANYILGKFISFKNKPKD